MDEVTRLALELAWQEGWEASSRYAVFYDDEPAENPYKRKKVVQNGSQDE